MMEIEVENVLQVDTVSWMNLPNILSFMTNSIKYN